MKLIERLKSSPNELQQHFTVRTATLLKAMGIETWEQLSHADDKELLKHPAFNKRSLTECLDLLQLYVDNQIK